MPCCSVSSAHLAWDVAGFFDDGGGGAGDEEALRFRPGPMAIREYPLQSEGKLAAMLVTGSFSRQK